MTGAVVPAAVRAGIARRAGPTDAAHVPNRIVAVAVDRPLDPGALARRAPRPGAQVVDDQAAGQLGRARAEVAPLEARRRVLAMMFEQVRRVLVVDEHDGQVLGRPVPAVSLHPAASSSWAP